jgi:hypothetical protein
VNLEGRGWQRLLTTASVARRGRGIRVIILLPVVQGAVGGDESIMAAFETLELR